MEVDEGKERDNSICGNSVSESFLFPPSPQLSGYISFTPPGALDVLLHSNMIHNKNSSVEDIKAPGGGGGGSEITVFQHYTGFTQQDNFFDKDSLMNLNRFLPVLTFN